MKNRSVILKLSLLLVAAPLAIWFGALSGTVDNYLRYRSLGKTVSAATERDNRMDLSSVAGHDIVSDGSVIADIEKRCPAVSISSYSPKIEMEEKGLSLAKAKLELKGDYKSLLKTLHDLETDDRFSLSEITFERKDEREKSVTLRMTINQLVKDGSE